jgi:hypothetical protein
MKLWTIAIQSNWFKSALNVPVGTKVTPKRGSYTGNKDRFGRVATIDGIAIRDIADGHVALADGFTHEELYRVTYDDGISSVLWPEEFDVLGGIQ